jgi:hypothetical protein
LLDRCFFQVLPSEYPAATVHKEDLVTMSKLLVTLLIGCAATIAPRFSLAAGAIDQVTVGYSSFSGAYVPLWVAVEEQLGRNMAWS